MKRKRGSVCIPNPFIKEDTLSWTINEPASLTRSISPPPKSSRQKSTSTKSTAAQVEAGQKYVEDHLSFFSQKLSIAIRPNTSDRARIDHQLWIDLYTTNAANPDGHHFVIHQHDHPVAGIHYDLRLQCNSTSSVSWAIMYGLPGDPNSKRLNRNATETRIHCLWNHLIETASHQTGSLLIWDTGTYEVLPYHDKPTQSGHATTDEEDSEDGENHALANTTWNMLSEPQKLHSSFQSRRIRLRLHGTQLPKDYTVLLWLRRENDRTEQPSAPKTRRRKGPPSTSNKPLSRQMSSTTTYNTDSESDFSTNTATAAHSDVDSPALPPRLRRNMSSLHRHEPPPVIQATSSITETESAEELLIRSTNAYPGADNTINSIHQRRWFLTLDRAGSGFIRDKASKLWKARHHPPITTSVHPRHEDDAMHGNIRQRSQDRSRSPLGSSSKSNDNNDNHSKSTNTRNFSPGGFRPFHVFGRDHERSVVTGRRAQEILRDEGVVGFIPRGKWRAVVV